MTHISIIKEGDDPLEVIPLNACTGCDSGCRALKKYHCPICSVARFAPKESLFQIKKHLAEHFTTKKKVVSYKGLKIALCSLPCIATDKKYMGHYHCPYCSQFIHPVKKFLEHLTVNHDSSYIAPVNVKKYLQDFSVKIEPPLSTSKEANGRIKPEVTLTNSRIKPEVTLTADGRIKPEVTLTNGVNGRIKMEHTSSNEMNRLSQSVKSEVERADVHSVISEYKRTHNSSCFEEIFQHIKNENDTFLKLSWIAGLTEYAPVLDKNADTLVLSFFKIPLFNCDEVARAAKNLIGALIHCHNYYAYHILKKLFQSLIPEITAENLEPLLVSAGSLSEEEQATYDRILTAIILINADIPMTQDNLAVLAKKNMPFYKMHVHQHAVYARNLLLLATRLPHLRPVILEVIFTNMITIDVHAPRAELAEEEDFDNDDMDSSDDEEEDMFDMEMDDPERVQGVNLPDEHSALDSCQVPRPMSHRTGNTLDVLMSIMLQYVHDVCHGNKVANIPQFLRNNQGEMKNDPNAKCRPGYLYTTKLDPKRTGGCECGGYKQDVESLKKLYNEIRDIFSSVILRTHASSHVQFILFYMVSLRPGILVYFADFLIAKKFKDNNSSQCIRKNAMAYIGSLLARGKHISIFDVHACLESIRDWCNAYLDAQEQTPDRNYEDIMLHTAFYSACQTLFYVFTFRYKQYTENKRTLSLARSLNLDRFIHSKLNPLNVCSPPVVNNFALIAQHYQIAYCYTILENNKRQGIPVACLGHIVRPVTTLESFFPFDPYLLSRSKLFIENHYREFEGLPEDIGSNDCMDVDTMNKSISSPDTYDPMCGISPGFVRFSSFMEGRQKIDTGSLF